ncbi:MAG: P-loop NTPase [Pseudomonadota bacterium]
MFGRMKDAARWGALEQRLRRILAEKSVHKGAAIRLSTVADQERISVVLAETPHLDGAGAKELEAALNDAADGLPVTLVATMHQQAGASAPATQAPKPDEARISRGHNNPLALPGGKGAAEGRENTRARPLKQRPIGAKRVIAVASGKGGVGKSTVAARLALALAAQSPGKVGLLDLDIYGPSMPMMFDLDGIQPKVDDGQVLPLEAAGLKIMSIGFLVSEEKALAWRGPMVMGASKQLLDEVRWGPLDWLIIDTPPGTGDAHLTLLQRTRIDGAVIVTTPSPLAVADMRRGATLFRQMEVPILGLVENMATLPDGTPSPFGPGLSDADLSAVEMEHLARLPLDPNIATPIGRTRPEGGQAPFEALAKAISELDRFAEPA